VSDETRKFLIISVPRGSMVVSNCPRICSVPFSPSQDLCCIKFDVPTSWVSLFIVIDSIIFFWPYMEFRLHSGG
jgi:hypothetical protein